MSKRRLGKGIDALLQGRPLEELSSMATILQVELERLHPNPRQPRSRFNQDSLKELAESIREKGVIQPIIAEDRGDGSFTIVAGERRYRAAKLAGLSEIPVISHDFTDEEKLEIALVENLQREDLNPMDEALAFESAMTASGYTQEQLAGRLGKSRSAIANSLRLLKLEPEFQSALAAGEISAGHARALLALPGGEARRELFNRIMKEGLSVRESELAVRPEGGETPSISGDESSLDLPPSAASATPQPRKSPELQRVEDELIRALGTRVTIRGTDESGRIEIDYYSTDDLDRLLEVLGISLD